MAFSTLLTAGSKVLYETSTHVIRQATLISAPNSSGVVDLATQPATGEAGTLTLNFGSVSHGQPGGSGVWYETNQAYNW